MLMGGVNPDDKLRRLYCFHDVCDIPRALEARFCRRGVLIDNAACPLNYDVSTIFVDIDSRNPASIALAKGLEFTYAFRVSR